MSTEAEMSGGADARSLAVSLFEQGKSPAEVWDALVADGMQPTAAQALVSELLELRRQALISELPSIETLPNLQTVREDEGRFEMGFLAGLFAPICSCAVVLVLPNWNVGRETKRGVYYGSVAGIVLAILFNRFIYSR